MKVDMVQASFSTAHAAVLTRFNARLTKLPGLVAHAVTVSVEGQTAVLRGKVASKEEGEKIGRLALLEPGISTVKNELSVDPSLVPPETLPPGESSPAAR